MCPICRGKVINVIYGPVTDINLKMHQNGDIILAGDMARHGLNAPQHYCPNCEEVVDIMFEAPC